MKIHRIHVWNMAGIREREVEFAPGTTVVEGPNESGKTTLLAALDRLLFAQDTSRAKDIRQLQPKDRPESAPEVEAELTFGTTRVTYRKRWLHRPETIAKIRHDSGRVEHLAGGEAHERVIRLMEAHVNVALWQALRVQQGRGWLDRIEPGRIPSLIRVLEGMSDSARPDSGSSLMTRLAAEKQRYWTGTWKKTKQYAEAERELAAARQALATLERERQSAEAQADELVRVERERAGLREQAVEVGLRRERVEQAAKRVDEAVKAVGGAELATRSAQLDHDAAQLGWGARSKAVREAKDAQAALASLERELQGQEEEVARLERQRKEASARCEEARRVRGAAEAAFRAAERHAELLSAQGRREGLIARLKQVRDLGARRTELAPAVERGRDLPDLLDAAERIATEVTAATARLEAQAPRVEVRATAPVRFEVDGDAIQLPADGGRAWTVGDRLSLRYRDLALDVVGGVDAAEEVRRQRDAGDRLTAVLRDAGAESLEDLRGRVTQAAVHRSELDGVQEDLKRLLGGETAEDLEGEVAVLSDRIADLECGRDLDRTLPPSEAEARRTAEDADVRVRQARELEEAALDALRVAEAQWNTVLLDRATAATRLDEARQRAERLARELEADRAVDPDEVREEALAAAAAALRAAREHEAALRTELEELGPEQVELERAQAAGAVDDVGRLIREADRRSDRLIGSLETIGGLGLDEQVAEAEATVLVAEAKLGRVATEASAVQLLMDLLEQERQRAQRTYLQPYQEALERYGRLVFGPRFAVELDEELAVTARVDRGSALQVELLSIGAQEQLAILARAACARLAGSHGEPVPLVLDDAFGYSDPDRLRKLGAVLLDLSKTTQVLVMTCMPDRYRWAAGASVVHLERELEPAAVGRPPAGADGLVGDDDADGAAAPEAVPAGSGGPA
jgi:uncharacterized protein YhaN